MPRQPASKVPHHVIFQQPKREVQSVRVTNAGGKIVERLDATWTYDQIYEHLQEKWGPGRYMLQGENKRKQPLSGQVPMEVQSGVEAVSPVFKVHQLPEHDKEGETKDIIIKTTELMHAQNESLLERQLKWEQQRREYEEEQAKTRKQASDGHVNLLMKFMGEQEKMRLSMEKEREKIRLESIERDSQRQKEHQQSMKELQAMRDKQAEKEAKANNLRWEQRIRSNDEMWKSRMEALQTAFETKMEAIRVQQEAQMDILAQEYKRKTDITQIPGVPKDIMKLALTRQIDEVYPAKSWVERVMEQYVQPAMESLSELPWFQQKAEQLMGAPGLEPDKQLENQGGNPVELGPEAGAEDGEDLPDEFDSGAY